MLPSAGAAVAADIPSAAKDGLPAVYAALQNGEADRALAVLNSLPPAAGDTAEAHNLACRVRMTLEQWNTAAAECDRAVRLDPENSDWHLWLGRALGWKANSATFLNAYSLAKEARAEFEESVRLDPHDAQALADLGDFYRQAPGIVGGGIDKALAIAGQLAKIDPARADELYAHIAEEQKDYVTAERDFKQAIAVNPHPALSWTTLASFYRRRKRFAEMESALRSANSNALRDKHASVAFFDAAGVLIEAGRDPRFAEELLGNYLAAPIKTEEAPVFAADMRLARLKDQLGDTSGASRDRQAAMSLAAGYKPAPDAYAVSPNR